MLNGTSYNDSTLVKNTPSFMKNKPRTKVLQKALTKIVIVIVVCFFVKKRRPKTLSALYPVLLIHEQKNKQGMRNFGKYYEIKDNFEVTIEFA